MLGSLENSETKVEVRHILLSYLAMYIENVHLIISAAAIPAGMKCKTPNCTRSRRAREDGDGYYDFCGKSCRDGSYTTSQSGASYFTAQQSTIVLLVFYLPSHILQLLASHAIFQVATSQSMWTLPMAEYMTTVGAHMPTKRRLRVSLKQRLYSLGGSPGITPTCCYCDNNTHAYNITFCHHSIVLSPP